MRLGATGEKQCELRPTQPRAKDDPPRAATSDPIGHAFLPAGVNNR